VIKILVPIDGSDHSETIIKQLLNTVATYKDTVELHVLNVQPPVPYGNKVAHAIGHESLDHFVLEQGEHALEKSLMALDAAGASYHKHIVIGDAAEVILRMATENGCSQIFMGTHGKGAIKGLLLGSVASRVLNLSTIPVTVVRQ
jgi:nucleotide-binding universal stress UspA family protein